MMKFLITNRQDLNTLDLPRGCYLYQIGKLSFISEKEIAPENIDQKYLFNDGYLRVLDKDVSEVTSQIKGVTEAISKGWPLTENITGSFSAVMIAEQEETISLCTDQIGLYPLYYLTGNNDFFFSNSIILTGMISGAKIDPTGVLQRSLGPDFSNQGSRTILKNCKRLLPGECRRYDFKGSLISVDFDNRLYENLSKPNQDHDLTKEYWKAYKKEVLYCLNDSEKVNIALSGGIDSRVALGAIPEAKEITCYTFGSSDNYESKIASRLAKLKPAKFKPCYQPDLYFPTPEQLKEYTWHSEGVELCSWLEITEKADNREKEPLLLGELCEALPARKIAKFSSREFRQNNFIKYYIRNEDYNFEASSPSKFEKWKQKKLKTYLIFFHEKNLAKFDLDFDYNQVREELISDLEEIFKRIEAHNLAYTELYDELFSWYTYTRMRLSKQLLVASTKFDAYSPAMSLQMLKRTSSLHPNIRLNYRFIKKLFSDNKELRRFYRVPTNQAPWIPQNASDLFKFASWGLRSKIDQFLIKRLMKAGDPSKRYRLFKSINWVKVYQNPNMEKNLNEYFKNDHLGKQYVESIKTQAKNRRDLKQWPFANMNIINAAALNVELELISSFRKQHEV
ncbi:hypothetical protein APR41_12105 [Salegentibacter salinarum]|uniref:asparagine synthase (glutamine-hydrolyzing) n=1 Tax=Salegentibacter salinarum TaxID=447422 RepID=A0A2N0U2B8_9FLAO|nr:hypothetical protein [Salegentibacter salinarum]PKD21151.1 hypothetical protein APR41_12105 [Salegentibacter salinarum]SKB76488.1 hypothetical protein SAMN05660903_02468 [Salegentibacter salinarum]